MLRLLQTKPGKLQCLITVTTIHDTILATRVSEAISVIKTKEKINEKELKTQQHSAGLLHFSTLYEETTESSGKTK